MAQNRHRDLTIDEFYQREADQESLRKIQKAADEGGGPRFSMVPHEEREIAWPTDLVAVPDASDPSWTAIAANLATPIDELELTDSRNRLFGWSADRQRVFLATLAETGSVHLSSSEANLSARSAYRLRTRSPAFAAAWDTALRLAVGRLSAVAFDRALNGRIEQVYRDDVLIGERRVPNDRLLTWLLARLDPKNFALPWEQRGDTDPQAAAVAAFPGQLDDLTDAIN